MPQHQQTDQIPPAQYTVSTAAVTPRIYRSHCHHHRYRCHRRHCCCIVHCVCGCAGARSTRRTKLVCTIGPSSCSYEVSHAIGLLPVFRWNLPWMEFTSKFGEIPKQPEAAGQCNGTAAGAALCSFSYVCCCQFDLAPWESRLQLTAAHIASALP